MNELTSPRMCWRLLLEHLVYWQIHPGTKHDWKWEILSWNNIPCIFNKIWWRLTHSFSRHSSLDLYIEITSYCFINPCSLCTIETMCFEDEYMPLWCYSKRKGGKNPLKSLYKVLSGFPTRLLCGRTDYYYLFHMFYSFWGFSIFVFCSIFLDIIHLKFICATMHQLGTLLIV